MVGAKVLLLEPCQPDMRDYKIIVGCAGEEESVVSAMILLVSYHTPVVFSIPVVTQKGLRTLRGSQDRHQTMAAAVEKRDS